MKRLFMLLLIALIPLTITFGEAIKTSKTTLSIKDSLTAADTVATTKRFDGDTTSTLDVSKFTDIAFVFESLEDTNFVNDSVFFIWQYKVDGSGWFLVDTIFIHLTNDTTYGTAYYKLDTLPPMDYIRIIAQHNDALESSANNVGLFENVYTTTVSIWLKGIK